jgi:hypothetical protein
MINDPVDDLVRFGEQFAMTGRMQGGQLELVRLQ